MRASCPYEYSENTTGLVDLALENRKKGAPVPIEFDFTAFVRQQLDKLPRYVDRALRPYPDVVLILALG